jgi:hypothetical protein
VVDSVGEVLAEEDLAAAEVEDLEVLAAAAAVAAAQAAVGKIIFETYSSRIILLVRDFFSNKKSQNFFVCGCLFLTNRFNNSFSFH